MKILKKLCSFTLAVAVFSATATGAFAANLGREETREYTVENLSVSFPNDGTAVTVSGVELPFDAGSVKVTYTSAVISEGNLVKMIADGTTIAETEF